ncbi:unnamed protein product, partial [Vitis vinifera]
MYLFFMVFKIFIILFFNCFNYYNVTRQASEAAEGRHKGLIIFLIMCFLHYSYREMMGIFFNERRRALF